MPLVRMLVFWMLVVACGGAPSNPPQSRDGAWSELRVSWSYGPCPDDGRSCHQELTVHADGGFVAAETANSPGSGGNGEAVRRFAALTSRETSALHRIVDAPGFLDKVGSFDCPREYDATIALEVTLPSGVRRQEVGGCVHASAAQQNAPRALIELLEHHRFASHDVPTKHAPLPGQGEDCTEPEGCENGLVCVVSPCVVAPCVNGSCQKLTR